MKSYRLVFLQLFICLGCLLLAFQVGAEEKKGSWNTVTKEIREAAQAVGNASGESWRKTKEVTTETLGQVKEKSAEVWSKTKEQSSELAGKTVEKTGDVSKGTVEKSTGLWQKVKKKSKKWMNSVRVKIHKLTEPKPKQISV